MHPAIVVSPREKLSELSLCLFSPWCPDILVGIRVLLSFLVTRWQLSECRIVRSATLGCLNRREPRHEVELNDLEVTKRIAELEALLADSKWPPDPSHLRRVPHTSA
jgi:hypothetical protein